MSDQKIPSSIRFLFGALSGVGATIVVYPLDLLKNRMQVSGEGGAKKEYKTTGHAAVKIVQTEGVRGLYNGLTASMLRQVTWTGGRMGAYASLIDLMTAADGTPPSLMVKTLCASAAGIFGGLVGLPADVSLTRMAVDGRLPKEQQRGYNNVVDAIIRMVKEEGPTTIFRGCLPVIVRAVIVNVVQLVSYATSKEYFVRNRILEDNTTCHITCSIIATVCTTTACLPFDTIKTRLQNMHTLPGKDPPYLNMFDCTAKIVTKEGVFALWKGYTALMTRNGPQFMCLFIFYENLTKYYKLFYKID